MRTGISCSENLLIGSQLDRQLGPPSALGDLGKVRLLSLLSCPWWLLTVWEKALGIDAVVCFSGGGIAHFVSVTFLVNSYRFFCASYVFPWTETKGVRCS